MDAFWRIWERYFPQMTLSPLQNWGLLILRVSTGLMMLPHGWGKLLRFVNGESFADPLGLGPLPSLILAIFAELICSLFLIFGLFTRVACLPLIVTMLVAALIIHGADPFAKKELALLYLSTYLSLGLVGPGAISLDHILRQQREKTKILKAAT